MQIDNAQPSQRTAPRAGNRREMLYEAVAHADVPVVKLKSRHKSLFSLGSDIASLGYTVRYTAKGRLGTQYLPRYRLRFARMRDRTSLSDSGISRCFLALSGAR